jgi:hypothetical protein
MVRMAEADPKLGSAASQLRSMKYKLWEEGRDGFASAIDAMKLNG